MSVGEIRTEYRPLSEEELEDWCEAARSHYDPKARIIGFVSAYCGLTVLPLSHLRPDWLHGDVDNLKIFVPAGPFECDIGEDGNPCTDCKCERGGVYSMGRHAPRFVPVPDEEIAELLVNHFELRDRTGFTNKVVNKRLAELGEEAGLDIRVSGRNLRYTYGTILARKGFSLEAIRDAMGYTEDENSRGMRHARRFYDWIRDDDRDTYPCGHRLTTGERCQRNRADPTTKCHFHREDADLCGVESSDGSFCKLNSNCPVHGRDFECGAETRLGEPCSNPVSERDAQCPQHRGSTPSWELCGYELEDGSRCQNAASNGGRCWRHDGRDQTRCGAETGHGPCQVPVSSPEGRCRDHPVDDGWEPNRCGYELDDGDLCSQQVQGPDDRCRWHQ
jgi:hypothetical protein